MTNMRVTILAHFQVLRGKEKSLLDSFFEMKNKSSLKQI